MFYVAYRHTKKVFMCGYRSGSQQYFGPSSTDMATMVLLVFKSRKNLRCLCEGQVGFSSCVLCKRILELSFFEHEFQTRVQHQCLSNVSECIYDVCVGKIGLLRDSL